MGKTALSVIASLFVIFGSFFSAQAAAHQRTDRPIIPRWWERPKLVQKLGISSDQMARIREIYRNDASDVESCRANLRGQRYELQRLLSQESLNEEKIAAHSEAVSSAIAALVKAEIDLQTKLFNELYPEQRKQLIRTLDQALEQPRKKAKHNGKTGEKRARR